MAGADRTRRWRTAALAAVVFVVLVLQRQARAEDAPRTVAHVATAALAGDWYEVATTTSFWHRRCLSDTRYRFSAPRPDGLDAASVCTTSRGIEVYRGRLRAASNSDGRLSIRFAPRLFSWLPATWADFWILTVGEGGEWLLIGDNRRQRLAVLARTVAPDEASMAMAIAAARQAGYELSRLARVPHPAGATGVHLP